jgi:hypothetical protein
VLERAGEVKGVEIAASALEAADAAEVVGAFFRLNIIFAEFMTLQAVGAFITVKSHEKGGDAIEQGKYGAEGAEDSTPRSFRKENGDYKQDKNCQFKCVWPSDLPACNRLLKHIRDGLFQCPGWTDTTDKERMSLTKKIGDSQHCADEHYITEMSGPFRQMEIRSWNFGGQVLQEAEWADPAAKS